MDNCAIRRWPWSNNRTRGPQRHLHRLGLGGAALPRGDQGNQRVISTAPGQVLLQAVVLPWGCKMANTASSRSACSTWVMAAGWARRAHHGSTWQNAQASSAAAHRHGPPPRPTKTCCSAGTAARPGRSAAARSAGKVPGRPGRQRRCKRPAWPGCRGAVAPPSQTPAPGWAQMTGRRPGAWSDHAPVGLHLACSLSRHGAVPHDEQRRAMMASSSFQRSIHRA